MFFLVCSISGQSTLIGRRKINLTIPRRVRRWLAATLFLYLLSLLSKAAA
jgi:hypothetical protein